MRELPSETARARSGSFERGELEPTGGGVEETVRVGATFVEEPEDFDPLFELLDDGRLGPCCEEAIRTSFGEGAAWGQQVEVGDVEIEQLGAKGSATAAVAFKESQRSRRRGSRSSSRSPISSCASIAS